MKRSEAIEVIREVMAANHPLTDHNGCPYVSDEILKSLERYGMQPPFHESVDCGYTIRTFGWEKE
jgi:hypothetical protein